MEKELIERDLEILKFKQAEKVKTSLLTETLKEIESGRKKIVELEKFREDLNGMLVHDLKNPLSGIVSTVELLLSGTLGPINDEQKKYIEYSKISASRILSLINAVLDLKKGEEGKFVLNKSRFPVTDLLNLLSWINNYARMEEKELIFKIDKSLFLFGDKEMICRILENLLTNAIKHTPPKGKITLNIRPSGEETIFEVTDTGEGIPQKYLGRVFEKFFKVESQHFKTKIDTGLGLTFCKMAVEAHGGKIWAESEAGKGAVFKFSV